MSCAVARSAAGRSLVAGRNRRLGSVGAEEELAQLVLLLAGQGHEVGVGRSPLHDGEGLEHAVVHRARDLLPGAGDGDLPVGLAQRAGDEAGDRPGDAVDDDAADRADLVVAVDGQAPVEDRLAEHVDHPRPRPAANSGPRAVGHADGEDDRERHAEPSDWSAVALAVHPPVAEQQGCRDEALDADGPPTSRRDAPVRTSTLAVPVHASGGGEAMPASGRRTESLRMSERGRGRATPR
jgi:hypothetical protein